MFSFKSLKSRPKAHIPNVAPGVVNPGASQAGVKVMCYYKPAYAMGKFKVSLFFPVVQAQVSGPLIAPACCQDQELTPEALQLKCKEMKELAQLKINSSTHKLQYNFLYRLTQPTYKGEPKCDKDIYDRWHKGSLAEFLVSVLSSSPFSCNVGLSIAVASA